MSRLDELIRELCPNGVPFVRIQDCCALEKGKTPIQKAIPGEYSLVVTTAKRKTANTYQFDKPSVCIPLVSSRGHGVASLNEVFYQEGKFALGNILCAVTPMCPDCLSAKYLHVFLNYAKDTLLVPQMKGGANVSLSVDAIGRCKVPIPPIEVQREIVRILDKFTTLTAELTAELTARQKQYEFYKEKLYQFGPEVPVVCTSDIVVDKFWLMPATPNYVDNGVSYITSKNIRNGRIDFSNVKYISHEDYDIISKNRTIQKNDFLITMIGTIGETAFVNDFTCFYGQNIYLVRFDETKCLRKYYYYYLSMNVIKNALISKKNASSQGYIKAGSIDNLKIPLPSLKIQQRIVNILDRFDAICNDLTSGLPAEIEARKKQYEYYRDKLLSFQPLT